MATRERYPDLFSLDGRTALVTGAARGLGLAMAEALSGAGASIVATDIDLSPELEALGRHTQEQGRGFAAYPVDLGERPALYAFLAGLRKDHPRIDVLVSNAGRIARHPALDHADDVWDPVIELDLAVPFILAREIGRELVERGSGKIIFTASILGFQGGLGVPSYVAAKTGLIGLTRALANEWAPRGVNVNAVAPGYMATEMTLALRGDAARSASILSRIPAGRWGVPEDMAGAALFLATRASDYVHGQVLVVDGGWLSR